MLTYPGAGAIVDEDIFPADEKLNDEEIVGSGPYKLSQYKAGDQAVLEVNEEYTGDEHRQGPQVFVQYYSEPSALKLAVGERRGRRRLAEPEPDRHRRPRGQRRRHGRHGEGSEIRYWVWDVAGAGRQAAGDPPGRGPGLRP